MEFGKCHLCDNVRDLCESHVWPAFAYKLYAADRAKGGRFADLAKGRLTNEQYKCYWFCRGCEDILRDQETPISALCRRIEADPKGSHAYEETLLKFATSISFRTLKFYFKDSPIGAIRARFPAYDYWKRYLRGTRTGVNPYTQHVFVLTDNATGLDKSLGGFPFEEQGIVLSQIGPLYIVGQLTPELLSKDDQRTWRNSKVMKTGGVIDPITVWRSGTKSPETNNITKLFAHILHGHEVNTIRKVKSGNWDGREKRRKKGNAP